MLFGAFRNMFISEGENSRPITHSPFFQDAVSMWINRSDTQNNAFFSKKILTGCIPLKVSQIMSLQRCPCFAMWNL